MLQSNPLVCGRTFWLLNGVSICNKGGVKPGHRLTILLYLMVFDPMQAWSNPCAIPTMPNWQCLRDDGLETAIQGWDDTDHAGVLGLTPCSHYISSSQHSHIWALRMNSAYIHWDMTHGTCWISRLVHVLQGVMRLSVLTDGL